jgi:hypothetical protein
LHCESRCLGGIDALEDLRLRIADLVGVPSRDTRGIVEAVGQSADDESVGVGALASALSRHTLPRGTARPGDVRRHVAEGALPGFSGADPLDSRVRQMPDVPGSYLAPSISK